MVLIAGVLICSHWLGYYGHFGYDDMHYAHLAKQMAEGDLDISTDHYAYRWGLLAPLAMAYKWFGINDHTSALPAWLGMIGTLAGLWLILKSERLHIKWVTIAFVLLSNWILFYSDKIMPDIMVMLSVTGMIAMLYFQYFPQKTMSQHVRPAGLALFLMIGFLSKLTIVLIIPWLLFFLIRDIVLRQHQSYWKSFSIWTLLLFGLYFTAIWWTTGHPFARFHAINMNPYFSDCSYSQLPLSHLLKRVSYELLLLFVRSGLALGFIFILSSAAGRNI